MDFYRREDEPKDVEEEMDGLELPIATDDCSLIFFESQLNISDDVNEIITKLFGMKSSRKMFSPV